MSYWIFKKAHDEARRHLKPEPMINRTLGPSRAVCENCGRSYSTNPPETHECAAISETPAVEKDEPVFRVVEVSGGMYAVEGPGIGQKGFWSRMSVQMEADRLNMAYAMGWNARVLAAAKDASQLEQAQTWIPVSERLPEGVVVEHDPRFSESREVLFAYTSSETDSPWVYKQGQMQYGPNNLVRFVPHGGEPLFWREPPPSPEVLNPT